MIAGSWVKWGWASIIDYPTDASTSYIRADVLRVIAAETNNSVQFDLYREHERSLERDRDMVGQTFSLALLMLFSRFLGSADAPTLLWQMSEFAGAPHATWAESAVVVGLWSLVMGLVGAGCVIRPMSVPDSGPCRYTIPEHVGTGFRSMSVHDSGACRYA